MAQPGVAVAAVVANVTEQGAQIVVAHVETDGTATDRGLRLAMSKAFPAGQRPERFVFHERLPRLPNGKIDKRALTILPNGEVETALSPSEEPDAPQRDLATVVSLFRETLSNPDFGEDDNFFEHGGYSLLALRLLMLIEDSFEMTLLSAAIYEAPTPRTLYDQHLSDSVEDGDPTERTKGHRPFVIPFNTQGEDAAVFAVHNLEENGSLYRDFAASFGQNHPFYGVGEFGAVNIGVDWVDDNHGSPDVFTRAKTYVDEIERIKPTGPIVIMGFCLGALYAYEVAQQLKARGRQPDVLVLLHDLHAPFTGTRHLSRIGRLIRERATQIRRNGLKSIPRFFQVLPSLYQRAARNVLRQLELRQLNHALARGQELSKRLNKRKFIEDAIQATSSYEYRPYDGRVAVVREGQSNFYSQVGFTGGWGDLLSNADFHIIENRPFHSFMEPPEVDEVANVITSELANDHNSTVVESRAIGRRFQSGRGHRIGLDVTQDDFIATPREEQRDWLLRQRLREMSQDLDYLDAQAKNAIAATGSLTMDDRAYKELSPDEIMEDWQIPLMRQFADVVARKGGDILEIGFGRGILSDFLQEHPITSHTIVECNSHVIDNFHSWAEKYPDSDLRLIEGRWEDVTDQFGQYDGIILHTYPLSEEELIETLATTSTFAETFFQTASSALRPGGRFTYFTNEADSLSRGHQRALLHHFGQFNITVLDDLNIPDNTADAHWFQSMVVVEAIKRKDDHMMKSSAPS